MLEGAQYVGMANNLIKYPEIRRIYQYANEILGYDLLKICIEGPVELLNTVPCGMPATFVTSLAAAELVRLKNPSVNFFVITCLYQISLLPNVRS